MLANFVTATLNTLDITECYDYIPSPSVTVTDGTSQNEIIFTQLKFNSLSATDYSFIILLSYWGNTSNLANYTARLDFITATVAGIPIADVAYTTPFTSLPIYPDANANHVYNSALCPAPMPLVACPVWGTVDISGGTTFEEGGTVTFTQNVTGSTAGWTFQWQKSTDLGGFVNIPLANTLTYTVPITETNGLYSYKLVITKPLGSSCVEPTFTNITVQITTACLGGLCADPNFTTSLTGGNISGTAATPVDYPTITGFIAAAYLQTFVDLLVLAGCYTVTITEDNQVDGGGNRLQWTQVKFQALNNGDNSFIMLWRLYGNDADTANFTLLYDELRKIIPLGAMNDVAFVTPYLPAVIADPTHYYLPTGTVCS